MRTREILSYNKNKRKKSSITVIWLTFSIIVFGWLIYGSIVACETTC